MHRSDICHHVFCGTYLNKALRHIAIWICGSSLASPQKPAGCGWELSPVKYHLYCVPCVPISGTSLWVMTGSTHHFGFLSCDVSHRLGHRIWTAQGGRVHNHIFPSSSWLIRYQGSMLGTSIFINSPFSRLIESQLLWKIEPAGPNESPAVQARWFWKLSKLSLFHVQLGKNLNFNTYPILSLQILFWWLRTPLFFGRPAGPATWKTVSAFLYAVGGSTADGSACHCLKFGVSQKLSAGADRLEYGNIWM